MSITSHTPKAIGIGIITVLFFIPSLMVQELISEREQRKEATVAEVSSKWGNAQTIGGPVLVVPYSVPTNTNGSAGETTSYAYFLPDQLAAKGQVKTETRARGIYEVPVYDLAVTMNGNFKRIDPATVNVPANRMKWGQAFVHVGIPDMRGVHEVPTLSYNGIMNVPFEPGSSVNGFAPGMRATLKDVGVNDGFDYSFTLNVKGSQDLSFLPLGKTTTVELTGDWKTPSFDGAFLPETHTVSDTGFSAQWKVLDLNRSFPQQWTDSTPVALDQGMTKNTSPYPWTGGTFESSDGFAPRDPGMPASAQPSAFGLRLFQPTDVYSQSDRAAKYAMAVIMLVFALVFFIEATGKRRVHPVQYVLIGLALVVFYTLLLSLSEYISFSLAYLLASLAIIGMVTAFTRRITHDAWRGWVAGGTLAVLYGFVYVLLRLEDYTLLIGSIGLFVILGVLMAASNKVSWYAEEAPGEIPRGPVA